MTENQERELFTTLAALVTGVNSIQTDVKDLKSDVRGLKSDVSEIKKTLDEHSQILNEHSQAFISLESKIDSVADKVLDHETRLTKAEKNIEDLQSGIH